MKGSTVAIVALNVAALAQPFVYSLALPGGCPTSVWIMWALYLYIVAGMGTYAYLDGSGSDLAVWVGKCKWTALPKLLAWPALLVSALLHGHAHHHPLG